MSIKNKVLTIKAKEYLMMVRNRDEMINNNLRELEMLQALAEKTTSVLGGDGIHTSGSGDKMAETVVKIVMLKNEINNEIDCYVDLRNEARKLIHEACDADCIKLLVMRYLGILNPVTKKVEYKKWEEIAVDLGFTFQWVSDGLHKRALSQLQKALDDKMPTQSI